MKTETQNRLQKKADIAFLSTSDVFFNLKSVKVFTPVSVSTRPPGHACICTWGAEQGRGQGTNIRRAMKPEDVT